MGRPVKITARLISPVVGEPPHMDAILEWQMAKLAESVERDDSSGRHSGLVAWRRRVLGPDADQHGGLPLVLNRGMEAPPLAALPIPIERETVAGWPVAKCSSPIYVSDAESVDRRVKRVSSGEIGGYLMGSRKSIHHGTGSTKAYYLPMQARSIDRVVWFCMGYGERHNTGSAKRRSPMATLRRRLKKIRALGSSRQIGYGQIAEWEVEEVQDDWSWYAPSPDGPVLMRPLPREAVPDDVVGARPDFASCCPPYWHPSRYTEAMVPC